MLNVSLPKHLAAEVHKASLFKLNSFCKPLWATLDIPSLQREKPSQKPFSVLNQPLPRALECLFQLAHTLPKIHFFQFFTMKPWGWRSSFTDEVCATALSYSYLILQNHSSKLSMSFKVVWLLFFSLLLCLTRPSRSGFFRDACALWLPLKKPRLHQGTLSAVHF